MADRGQRGDGVTMFQISISNRSRSQRGRGGGHNRLQQCVCVSVACVSSNTDNDETAISHDWKNVTKQLILGLRLNEGLNLRI